MNAYDFDAGDLCLDFANTSNWHASDHPIEGLTGFLDLITWSRQAGVLPPEAADELQKIAVDQPQEMTRYYDLAIRVREAIYRIFSHRYAGKSIPAADLSILNSIVRKAMAHRQLVQSGDEIRWSWTPDVEGVNLILWSVAFAAAHLLASPLVSRVRECEDNRGCGYLFIDMSKNHSRRWCSMESCGNRAKARRHYSRASAD